MRITNTLSPSTIVFLILSLAGLVYLAGLSQLKEQEPVFVDWQRDVSDDHERCSHPSFRGKTMQTVFDELGPPYSNNKIKLMDIMGEFYCELPNFYPLDRPENKNVILREVRWRQGDYWLVVFFHKVKGEWMFLYAVRYHKDIRF